MKTSSMTWKSLMVLIAGPYRSGTGDNPVLMERNLRSLEAAALPLYRAGHIPLIGEWLALPLLREAGSKKPGDTIYNEILYPIANRLITRCDGVLRLPGASKGADQDVQLARELGLPVWYQLADVPGCADDQPAERILPVATSAHGGLYAITSNAGHPE
jgi:hypothetical protein